MNRRSFVQRVVTAVIGFAALGGAVLGTGCNWEQDLQNWIPVGLQALKSILSLLSGAGIALGSSAAQTVSVIQQGLGDLKLTVVQYASTTPPPAGALQRIDALFSDIVSNIGNVLSQLPAQPARVVNLVTGLFELVLSTVQGFMTQVPMAPTAMPKTADSLKRALVINGKPAVIGPAKNLSRRHFISQFNKLAEAGGESEAKLPESLLQHV